jgi:hypothetical protein
VAAQKRLPVGTSLLVHEPIHLFGK